VDTARSSNKKQSLKISPQPAAFSNQNRLLVGMLHRDNTVAIRVNDLRKMVKRVKRS
jgi:hypothetical protein